MDKAIYGSIAAGATFLGNTRLGMRKGALAGAAVALLAVVAGFTVLGKPNAKAARPALRVVRTSPLKIRGEHFRGRERVRLTAGAAVVRATAGGGGVFVVTIHGATRCDSVRILARGSAGSYAVIKVLPSPACLPARSS
jgi:hypothetical protein